MANRAARQYNSVKGAMFETIVKILISKSGFLPLPVDRNYVRGDRLRGRGAWHQMDAFGLFAYGIPFLYPIRLMCEAKHYGNARVGLPDVRNFYGAFKDIHEVYYIEHKGQSMDLFTKRYTDAAALFSSSGFTTHAQDYAYAQGIKLISYESNPLMWEIIPRMEMCIDFINLDQINEILLLSQPAHLQKFYGSEMDQNRRDFVRAQMVREKLRWCEK